MEGTTLFTRALLATRVSALLAAALVLLPACGGGGGNATKSQASTQPPQATAPSVVQQPEGSGPILSNDQNPVAGTAVEGAEEGPLHRIHFEYDKSSINGEAQTILGKNADYLKAHQSTFIRIEGHCDERGSAEYNQALGERRANTARETLASLGIETKRMETISYGEDRPISFEHDEYGWALNRRAEFRILSE
jgi:peptidoglycan-associated lipoprotein